MSTQPTTFFAEVIESSIDSFIAQTWDWNSIPQYGSLVEVNCNAMQLVGVVTQVTTGSQDPVRKPFTYKKTLDELLREQPQIFAFLKTTFTVQIIGYFDTSNAEALSFFYLLPSQPATLHSFVRPCTPATYHTVLHDPVYLSLLFAFQGKIAQLDELLLALVRMQSHYKPLSSQDMRNFCNAYSLHTGNDYKRLKLFLQRCNQFLPTEKIEKTAELEQ